VIDGDSGKVTVIDPKTGLVLPPTNLLPGFDPAYVTRRGATYMGDSLELLKAMPDASVKLVVTSPPYALHFKKEYGNQSQSEYVEWFLPFAREVRRVLTDDGSFVINIGGAWQPGKPVRSLYHFRLLIALVDQIEFCLAQELYWNNPAKMPTPAEWVTVRRLRVKDSVEPCWWLSKTPWPDASNRRVLVEYSPDMKRLIKKGFTAKVRPSGHHANAGWQKDSGGAIPGNVLTFGNNDSNGRYLKACKDHGVKSHPARFPVVLPEFFIKFLTQPGDVIVDIFGGSMTAGWAAERQNRAWLGFDLDPTYIEASKFRFFGEDKDLLSDDELGVVVPGEVVSDERPAA